jgi:hypothetical protein
MSCEAVFSTRENHVPNQHFCQIRADKLVSEYSRRFPRCQHRSYERPGYVRERPKTLNERPDDSHDKKEGYGQRFAADRSWLLHGSHLTGALKLLPVNSPAPSIADVAPAFTHENRLLTRLLNRIFPARRNSVESSAQRRRDHRNDISQKKWFRKQLTAASIWTRITSSIDG